MDWLKKNDPTDQQSLEDLQDDNNIYLLPDYEEVNDIEKAIEKYIKSRHVQIFTHELSAWYLDPTMYPPITYETFRKWFAVAVHTMVYDTVSGDIDKE